MMIFVQRAECACRDRPLKVTSPTLAPLAVNVRKAIDVTTRRAQSNESMSQLDVL
jgi:hypothetical protein